jgi:hypothetical protein
MTSELFTLSLARGRALREYGRHLREEEDVDRDALENRAALSLQLLDADLPRTFPQLAFFRREDGPLRDALEQCLEALAGYRPDVGYVQGLGHLAAMWLLQDPEPEKAFRGVANLVFRCATLRDVFRCDGVATARRCRAFEAEMHEANPVVARTVLGDPRAPTASAELFVIPWLASAFTTGFQLDDAVRLWDVLLLEMRTRGEAYVWRMVAGIVIALLPWLTGAEVPFHSPPTDTPLPEAGAAGGGGAEEAFDEDDDNEAILRSIRSAAEKVASSTQHLPEDHHTTIVGSAAALVAAEARAALGIATAECLADVLLANVKASTFDVHRFLARIAHLK